MVYLHIGLRRSASTFLQKEVFPKLDPSRIHFVPTDDPEVNQLVKRICFEDDIYFDAPRVRRELDRHLDRERDNLISREVLSGDPYNGGIHRSAMLRKLNRCFPDGRVILFIRRQDTFSFSNYKTALKRGLALSVKDYYRPALDYDDAWVFRYPNPTLDAHKYHAYIRLITELFGRDRMLVLPYEALAEDPSGTLERLCGFMSVLVPEYRLVRNNRSSGRIALTIRQWTNLFVRDRHNPYGFWQGIPVYSFRKRRLRHVSLTKLWSRLHLPDLVGPFDPPFRDTTGSARRLLTLCAEDNRQLDEEFALDLKRFGYY